jgi:hypothetical protein
MVPPYRELSDCCGHPLFSQLKDILKFLLSHFLDCCKSESYTKAVGGKKTFLD